MYIIIIIIKRDKHRPAQTEKMRGTNECFIVLDLLPVLNRERRERYRGREGEREAKGHTGRQT